MRLLGKAMPNVVEKRADEVEVGDQLATGRYQAFELSNAHAGEIVLEVTADGGLIYIVGDRAPGASWTLAPEETVMIVKED